MTFITLDQTTKTKADLLEESRKFAQACLRDADQKASYTVIHTLLQQQDKRIDALIFKLQYIIDELKETITDQYFDNKKDEITETDN